MQNLVLSIAAAMCMLVSSASDPANGLPEQMPADFTLSYAAWYDEAQPDGFDLAQGIVQKDLVLDGAAQAEFTPDETLRQQVYALLVQCEADTIVQPVTAQSYAAPGEGVGISPNRQYEIHFTANGKTYTLTGDSTGLAYTGEQMQAARFQALVQELQEILQAQPAYQALPQANGGYL